MSFPQEYSSSLRLGTPRYHGAMDAKILLYGAYGYSGALIAEEAKRRGFAPVLAGRRREPLEALGKKLDLPIQSFGLDDPAELDQELAGMDLVLHAAGPFSQTARPMREAALRNRAHYLDITGEISVFEESFRADAKAKEAGVVVMSGVGFDVVPSDCLALALAQALPGAEHLRLAFYGAGGSFSKGTLKTMLSSPGPNFVRSQGKIVEAPKDRVEVLPFSSGEVPSLGIPWGDVSTAFVTTQIPNIEVFTGFPGQKPWQIRALTWAQGIFRLPGLNRLALNWVERNVTGPTEAQRKRGRSYLYGKVSHPDGRELEGTLETVEGYRLTALASVEVMARVLTQEVGPGATTPAKAFGVELLEAFEDTQLRLGEVRAD